MYSIDTKKTLLIYFVRKERKELRVCVFIFKLDVQCKQVCKIDCGSEK